MRLKDEQSPALRLCAFTLFMALTRAVLGSPAEYTQDFSSILEQVVPDAVLVTFLRACKDQFQSSPWGQRIEQLYQQSSLL